MNGKLLMISKPPPFVSTVALAPKRLKISHGSSKQKEKSARLAHDLNRR